jgi:hypothetical protein
MFNDEHDPVLISIYVTKIIKNCPSLRFIIFAHIIKYFYMNAFNCCFYSYNSSPNAISIYIRLTC